MNRDDIIKMALEAGALQIGFNKTFMQSEFSIFVHELERFFHMAQAAEREACAKRLEAVGCDHCAANIRARGNQ